MNVLHLSLLVFKISQAFLMLVPVASGPYGLELHFLGLFCSVPFQRRSLLMEFLVSLVGLQGLVVFLDDGSADTRNTPSSALR